MKKTVIYLLMFLMVVPVNLLSFSIPVKAAEQTAPTKVEIQEARTVNSKTYQLANGTKEKVIYREPIHYLSTETGRKTWQDIDTNFIAEDREVGTYKNKANGFGLVTNNSLVGKGVEIAGGDSIIKLRLAEISSSKTIVRKVGFNKSLAEATKPSVSRNKAVYQEIAADTDIVYYSMPGGMKEDIVLKKYNGQNRFTFDLDLANTYFEKKSDGSYHFFDSATKNLIFAMPKFLMWDSRGGLNNIENEYSFDIDSSIVKNGNSWRVILTASDKWLSDITRVFPITVDPSIDSYIGYGVDTYVQEGYPDYNMWVNRDMYVGRGSTKLRTRSLLPFSFDDLSNARIYSATFNAYQFYCTGVCASTSIDAELTRDYDPYAVTWNTQPAMLGIVGQTTNGTSDGWVIIDVTNAARHWFNDGNPSGSKVGSFMFTHGDEGSFGYRQWVAENHPDAWAQDKKPHLVISYNDYNARYGVSTLPANLRVLGKLQTTAQVTNTGRNDWITSQTKLGYHLKNNSTGQQWDGIADLPNNVCAGGCSARVDVTIELPDSVGNYTLRWDMIQPGVAWYSDQGVPTANQDFYVADFPEYAVDYGAGNISSMVAGTTNKVPVEITNRSRYDWTTSTYSLGYHWYKKSTGELVIKDGIKTPVPNTIVKREGFGSVLAEIKAPVNAGEYILKFDMYSSPASAWFSDKGIPTLDKQVVISPPSYSSMTHLGTEEYYAKAGSLDLATGNVSFSVSDMSISSNTKGLNILRSYNSTSLDNTFSSDAAGYIKSWIFNGPYRENDQAQRLAKPYIAESGARPSVGSTSGNNLWFKGDETATPQMWLDKAFWSGYAYQQGLVANSAGYAFVYVYSPATKAVKLKLGSDDGLKVWLNGQNIYTNDIYRGFSLDSDSVNTNLAQGWNSLLVKVSQANSSWQMSAKLTNPDDSIASDLKYSLSNPDVFNTSRVFGVGWTANFEESLSFIDTESVYYRDSTGTVNIFTKKSDGTYQRPNGTSFDLIRNADGTYALVEKTGVKTSFRPDGKMTSKSDLSANKINYEYDASGRCIKISDGSRYITINYNADNTVSSVINPLGEKNTYIYTVSEGKNFLDGSTNNTNFTNDYEYYGIPRSPVAVHFFPREPDARGYRPQLQGKLQGSVNKRGNRTRIFYNDDGKADMVQDALGQNFRFVYSGRTASITDPLGRINVAEFSENNVLVSFTNAKNYKEIYQMDGNYNITSITPKIDPNSNYFFQWAYQYDTNSNPLQETDPISRKQSFEYQTNDLVKHTDGNLNITQYDYSADGKRLLTSVKDPKNNIQTYSYDSSGRVIQATDPTGAKNSATYSTDGDRLTFTSPKNEKTSFSYDRNGKLTSTATPLGKINYFSYDSTGKVASIKDPAGLEAKSEYDENGNVAKTTNPKGGIKSYEYDKIDRLIKITDEIGAAVTYEYNAVGNKTKVTDSNGKSTIYKYNELDQLTEVIDPSGGVTKYEYNAVNNLSKIIKPNGNIVSLEMNKSGDITKISKPEGTTSVNYDSGGRVASITSGSESNNLTYDKNGNLTTLNSTNGNATFGYDQNNNQTTTGLTTNMVNYSYDPNEQVSKISSSLTQTGQVIANTFTRDAEGKLTKILKANGDTVLLTYDNSSRITSVTNRNNVLALQSKYSYQYDKNSNVTAISEQRFAALDRYTYDGRDQLLQENSIVYSYDQMGNRTKMVNAANTVNYTYDTAGDANRLLSFTGTLGGTTSYEYDQNGNVIKQVNTVGTTQYFYDSDDYFVKAVLPDGSKIEYVYDKLAKHRVKRIETSTSGVSSTTNYLWDQDRLVSETDQSGKIVRAYTWDENESLFSISLPDPSGNLQTYYYIKNGKGDIVGLSDASGKEVVRYGYDAWGNITKSAVVGTAVVPGLDKQNPRLFSGYWYEQKLGMYVMRARMYNPAIGRFISKDPMQVGSDALDYNPYIYCGNNPVNRIDPSGKLLFLAPLIAYAIAAAPLITAILYELVNSPVMQTQLADSLSTATDKTKTTTDRVIGGFCAAASFTPAGSGGKSVGNSVKATRAIQNAAKGRLGERNVGKALDIVKNTTIIKVPGQNNGRIFDFINNSAEVYYEVKNVKYQAWTKQLDDMYRIAQKEGFTFKLYVRGGINNVSKTVIDMIGRENILPIPGL